VVISDNTRVAKKSDLAGLWEPGGRRSYFRANTTRSALSALVHPLRISLALSVVCLVLHDLLSPVRDVGARHLTRDATILLGYLFVVVVVNQLGAQRRRLAELAERQRDELANEIQLAAEVQQSILPRSIPTVPGFEFAARMYPAKTVSGDYLDSSSFPRGRSPW